MRHLDVVPVYAELLSCVDYCEQAQSVAEIHGMLCGLLCRDAFIGPSRWIPVLQLEGEPQDERYQMVRGQLEELLAHSARMLNQIETEFYPVLPDDDESLQWRIKELAHWCQGYLFGFSNYRALASDTRAFDYEDPEDEFELEEIKLKAAQAAQTELQQELAELDAESDKQQEFPETVEEILRDFAELARAGHQDDALDETDEAAFMELLEYLRVSVQLVFEEMAGQHLQGREEKIEVDPMYQLDSDNDIVH
ncbi:MAG: UPF0149 family protein [Gammaproteobacteria bacterium]|nr:UPF0149 family protein [Gammaproteobacteria bacterium]NNC97631.1 UPF0149 family protein [Gammaproteobacteria bacterium]NNM14183.1 UPF0149 family protein [Gammaproteobacteria bacterium]